jgi:uncharacterized membrane protein
MKKHPLVALLIFFALLGIADSAYLAESALTHTPLTCNIGSVSELSGCNIVAQSQYSHLFGIPLGVYGVVFYLLVFLVSCLLLAVSTRRAHAMLVVLGVVGFVASLVFVAIQVFLIKALCIYCLASAVIAFFTFLLAFVLWKQFAPPKAAPVAAPIAAVVP